MLIRLQAWIGRRKAHTAGLVLLRRKTARGASNRVGDFWWRLQVFKPSAVAGVKNERTTRGVCNYRQGFLIYLQAHDLFWLTRGLHRYCRANGCGDPLRIDQSKLARVGPRILIDVEHEGLGWQEDFRTIAEDPF